MSGGVAFVRDAKGDFAKRCNGQLVDLEPLESPEDVALVLELIRRHAHYTYSKQATALLERWPAVQSQFVRVMSRDYKAALRGAGVPVPVPVPVPVQGQGQVRRDG
jgi:glutamate synthase domain-containing protein 3